MARLNGWMEWLDGMTGWNGLGRGENSQNDEDGEKGEKDCGEMMQINWVTIVPTIHAVNYTKCDQQKV